MFQIGFFARTFCAVDKQKRIVSTTIETALTRNPFDQNYARTSSENSRESSRRCSRPNSIPGPRKSSEIQRSPQYEPLYENDTACFCCALPCECFFLGRSCGEQSNSISAAETRA